MSVALDRLRVLRQQAGLGRAERLPATPSAAVLPPVRPSTTTTTVAELRRMLGVRQRLAPSALPQPATDRLLPGREIADGLRYIEERTPAPCVPSSLSLPDVDLPPIASERFLAFDTETTGLAGGTGTRAFMLGAADWVDGALRVRQLCITSLAAEAAMLAAFATWLTPDRVLVSYNGRSYDAPLLRTRCRLARRPDMLASLHHADLLHPTRRRYRGVWENCRLATIERQLLGIVREDDLPGSEAPGAWLRYLRGGSADLLRRVHAHNAQDVRTLMALLCRLSTPD